MSASGTGSAHRTFWRVMLVASALLLGWAAVVLAMAATGHSDANVPASAVVCGLLTLAAGGCLWELRSP